MKIVEAESVKDYLDRFYKPDRYTGRGTVYAEGLLKSYEEEYIKRGFIYTSRHDNVTGSSIAWPFYPGIRDGGN